MRPCLQQHHRVKNLQPYPSHRFHFEASTNTPKPAPVPQSILQLILIRSLCLCKRPLPHPLLPHLLPVVPARHGVRPLPEQPRRAALIRLADVPRVDGEGDVATSGVAVREGERLCPGYYGVVLEVGGVL